MKKRGKRKSKLLMAILWVIFGYFILTLILTLASTIMELNMFVDFPCFTTVSENGCLMDYNTAENSNIEAYITTSPALASGGGCWHVYSDTGEVSVVGYTLKKNGEMLTINDRITLAKGGGWGEEKITLFSLLNPWRLTKERNFFTSLGLINCQENHEGETSAYGPVLVVEGYSDESYILNYLGIILFIICAYSLKVFYRKSRKK